MYDCVILAGGYGKRLYPLTDGFPKPLVSVGGMPVMEHTLAILEKAGVEKCSVTLMYEGEQIKERFGKEYRGMKLDYFTETTPLGTAGGVKRAVGLTAHDSVIVLSGDGFFDVDVSQIAAYHETRAADVTICTCFRADPTEYGTVIADKDGRVTGFSEKAPWSKTVTGNVNTGIYVMRTSVFENVPDGEPFDFAKDLFPKLLESGAAVYAMPVKGYWCDIGTLPELYEGNMAVLNGLVKTGAENHGFSGNGSATRHNLFSEDCVVLDGALADGSVFSPRALIKKGATVKDCVLMEDVTVGENCFLDGCIVARGTSVSPGLVVKDKVIAKGCMRPINADANGFSFTDSGLEASDEPAEYAALGRALAAAVGNGKIGFAHDGSGVGMRAASETASSASGSGCSRVYDFGRSWQAQTAFAAYSYGLGMSVFFSQKNGAAVASLYDSSTLPVCASVERAVTEALRNDRARDVTSGEVIKTGGLSARYTDALLKSVYGGGIGVFGLDGMTASINECPAKKTVSAALSLLDASVCTREVAELRAGRDFIEAEISDDGFDLTVKTGGAVYSRSQICAVLAADSAERGEVELSVAFERSPELEWADPRIRAENFSSSPTGRELMARYNSRRTLWINDAAFMLMRLMAVLSWRGTTLARLSGEKRQVWRREAVIPCRAGKAHVMDVLTKSGGEIGGEGVVIKEGAASARVICERSDALRVVSYASNSEAAADLCGRIAEKISEIK